VLKLEAWIYEGKARVYITYNLWHHSCSFTYLGPDLLRQYTLTDTESKETDEPIFCHSKIAILYRQDPKKESQ
jgi:hypothetical protein